MTSVSLSRRLARSRDHIKIVCSIDEYFTCTSVISIQVIVVLSLVPHVQLGLASDLYNFLSDDSLYCDLKVGIPVCPWVGLNQLGGFFDESFEVSMVSTSVDLRSGP